MHRIRKDDQVKVIAGKDAGKTGRVVKVFLDRDKALVEGVNYVKKHERVQSQRGGGQEGGIIETEAPVHLSNVHAGLPVVRRGHAGRVRLRDRGRPPQQGPRLQEVRRDLLITTTTAGGPVRRARDLRRTPR
jgi:large subunit ribosomal protein L24